MGLFERLQAAKRDRERGGVIDLAGPEPATRAGGPKAAFGMPSPCPECGKPGYLDHIDLVRRRQYQHCPYCLHKWEMTEAEVTAGP